MRRLVLGLGAALALATGAFVYTGTGQMAPNPAPHGPRRPRFNAVSDRARFRFLPTVPTGSIAAGTMPASTKGPTPTFARASSRTCTTASGGLATLASNQPCIESTGLHVGASVTNLLLRSEEFDNASWISSGTPIRTANTWTAPGDTLTGDTIADDDAAAFEGLAQLVTTSAGTSYTFSCWMQAGTSSNARLTFGTVLDCNHTLTSTAAARYSCTGTATAGSHQFTVYPAVAGNAAGTGSINVWGCQVEAGTGASRYVATAGTTATSLADDAAASVSLPASGWCVKATATPTFPWASGSRGVLAVKNGSTVVAELWMDGQTPAFRVYDSTATEKRITSTATYTSAVTVCACVTGAGSLSLTTNGTAASTLSGTGTGIPGAAGASLVLGNAASTYLSGSLSAVSVSTTGACL